MANKNYVKGYNFERRVLAYLWRHGYHSIRSYGSKGVFDILAIAPKGRLNKSLAIQAKNNKNKGYCSPQERKRLGVAARAYEAYCCIAYNDNRRLKWKLIPIWW